MTFRQTLPDTFESAALSFFFKGKEKEGLIQHLTVGIVKQKIDSVLIYLNCDRGGESLNLDQFLCIVHMHIRFDLQGAVFVFWTVDYADADRLIGGFTGSAVDGCTVISVSVPELVLLSETEQRSNKDIA